MGSACPLMTPDFTPPIDPASSPELMLKFASFSSIEFPSHLTVVLPDAVCADSAMLGYGTGTGPPGDGVLHTSSSVLTFPALDLCTAVSGALMFTVTGMGVPLRHRYSCGYRFSAFSEVYGVFRS